MVYEHRCSYQALPSGSSESETDSKPSSPLGDSKPSNLQHHPFPSTNSRKETSPFSSDLNCSTMEVSGRHNHSPSSEDYGDGSQPRIR